MTKNTTDKNGVNKQAKKTPDETVLRARRLGELLHVKGRMQLPFVLGVGERNKKTVEEITKALNAEFECRGDAFAQKTVRRYLEDLECDSDAELKVDDHKRPFKYYLEKPYPLLTRHTLSESLALVLVLASDVTREALPPDVLPEIDALKASALWRLERGKANGYREWRDKVRYVSKVPDVVLDSVEEPLRHIIYSAILGEQVLDCTYQGLNGQVAEWNISPLGLIFQDRICKVVCWREDPRWPKPRALPLHRFQTATPVEGEKFTKPLGFNLDDFARDPDVLEISRGYKPLSVRLRVRPTTLAWLKEQQIVSDGDVHGPPYPEWSVVTATMRDNERTRGLLRNFGTDVEVLHPPELREEFRNIAETLAQRYQRPAADE